MSTFKKIFKYDENIVTKESNDKKIEENELVDTEKVSEDETEKIEETKIDEKTEEIEIETDKNDEKKDNEKYDYINDPFFFT